MSVNFTGIKNVGSLAMIMPETGQKMYTMSLQLTNDENGNDLDDFKKAINKTKNPKKFMTEYDEGLVSVNIWQEVSEDEFVPNKNTFFLNASPLEVNDNNLPVYTYLAKLTKNISNKEESELPIESDFFATKDFIYGTSIGYYIRKIFEANPNISLKAAVITMHDPKNAIACANITNDAIQETMVDYIG